MILALFRNVAAMAILTVVYFLADFFLFRTYGFWNEAFAIANSGLIALSTYLGIFCQFLLSKLKARKSRIVNITEILKASFRDKHFWIALTISPIVVIAVYKGVKDTPDNVLAYIFAFQTGFSFRSIFEEPYD